MTTLGFDKPLYVLPFDHRGSFQTKMFGWVGELSPQQTAEIAAAKQVMYDAFRQSVAGSIPKEKAGILVDEQFGAAVLRDAAFRAIQPLARQRKADKMNSISNMAPISTNILKPFNPRSARCWCAQPGRGPESQPAAGGSSEAPVGLSAQRASRSRFMFELFVPAEKAQLDQLKGDKKAYDLSFAPG